MRTEKLLGGPADGYVVPAEPRCDAIVHKLDGDRFALYVREPAKVGELKFKTSGDLPLKMTEAP